MLCICGNILNQYEKQPVTTPWMYSFAGAPWKTQQVVRRILLELYSNSPGGMPGNDDGGVLSSWAVFASLGPYPQIPGVGGFVVGRPIFPQATVRLRSGASIRINAPAASPGTPYVQRLTVNGQDFVNSWLPWKVLSNGATVEFLLGDSPNKTWGSRLETAPPSFDTPEVL